MGILWHTAALQRGSMPVGRGPPLVHYCSARGSGHRVSFGTLTHCSGQWVVGLLYTVVLQGAAGTLQYIAALQGAQYASFNTLLHCRV